MVKFEFGTHSNLRPNSAYNLQSHAPPLKQVTLSCSTAERPEL